jgi:hypothetical protein
VRRGDDSAAFASNWRTVLLVDALVGVGVALGGVALLFEYNPGVGAAVIAMGAIYVVLIAVRARRWSRLRRADPEETGGLL